MERGRLRRISLRLLFVITAIVACFVAYFLKWKTDRENALEWMNSQAVVWEDLLVDQTTYHDIQAPIMLRLVGGRGLSRVCVVILDKQEVQKKQAELEQLFPEAEILVVSPGPGYKGKNAHLLPR